MRRKKTIVSGIVPFLLSSLLVRVVVAQTPAENRLTLPQALELARTNYPSLRGKLAELRAAEANVLGVRAALRPQVGIQAQALNGTSNQVRGPYVSNGGLALPISGSIKTNGFTNESVWTSGASVVMDWEAITFGRQQARRQQARAAVEGAQADYEGELFTHQLRVCEAYLMALSASKTISLQVANLQRAEALQRVASSNAVAGLRSGIDSAVATAEVYRARTQVLESQRAAQQQVIRLYELIGQPQTTMELDTMGFYTRVPDFPANPVAVSGLHPQLRFFQKQIDLGETTARLIKTAALPSVSLLGSLWGRGSGMKEQTASDGSFQIDPSLAAGLPLRAFNYLVGVTAIWRPTDLFRTKYALAAQNERINVLRSTYERENLTLQADVRNARVQLELAQETARQIPPQLAAARLAFSQAQSRYEAGLDTILTLTQVSALLSRSEADQALAITNLWRALLVQAATSGDLDRFIQNIPR
ncbi:TolC family protein [Larkinella sp. VNQ87]|uniref:TolC family protein n=1 Tax=Larkinella sp. VNQ87 TaxID=3400921 RepID=UPI003BFD5B1C